MFKIDKLFALMPALILIILVIITGCSYGPDSKSSLPSPIINGTSLNIGTTELARMLGYVPYSFLEKRDAWFGNQANAKQLYGFEGIINLDSFNQLFLDKQKELLQSMDG